uniref:Phospholipase A1 LCAT3 isoform X1 n=1 Tax=Rhizophora mucronata TaxID=61149 RepID=A0A2P2K1P7_RHIMU
MMAIQLLYPSTFPFSDGLLLLGRFSTMLNFQKG